MRNILIATLLFTVGCSEKELKQQLRKTFNIKTKSGEQSTTSTSSSSPASSVVRLNDRLSGIIALADWTQAWYQSCLNEMPMRWANLKANPYYADPGDHSSAVCQRHNGQGQVSLTASGFDVFLATDCFQLQYRQFKNNSGHVEFTMQINLVQSNRKLVIQSELHGERMVKTRLLVDDQSFFYDDFSSQIDELRRERYFRSIQLNFDIIPLYMQVWHGEYRGKNMGFGIIIPFRPLAMRLVGTQLKTPPETRSLILCE